MHFKPCAAGLIKPNCICISVILEISDKTLTKINNFSHFGAPCLYPWLLLAASGHHIPLRAANRFFCTALWKAFSRPSLSIPAPSRPALFFFNVGHVLPLTSRITDFLCSKFYFSNLFNSKLCVQNRISVNSSNVQSLLDAANQYQIEPVKMMCVEFLKGQIDATNCLGNNTSLILDEPGMQT